MKQFSSVDRARTWLVVEPLLRTHHVWTGLQSEGVCNNERHLYTVIYGFLHDVLVGWKKKIKWIFFSWKVEKTGEFFYIFLSNFRHLRIKSRFDDYAEYRINGSMVWGLQVLHTVVSLASHYRLRVWELSTVVYYPVSVRWGAPFCRRVEIVCAQIVFICWSSEKKREKDRQKWNPHHRWKVHFFIR